MALRKSVIFKGISIPAAYLRVTSPTINAGNTMMSFGLSHSATPEDGAFDMVSMECKYELYGENPIKQAYEHVKSLKEFEGYIDC